MKKKIFICDDDEGILDVTSLVIEQMGYEAVAIRDCKNIFSDIDRLKPVLILLDLWMPDISGDEVAKRLKSRKTTRNIPIIILSAHRDTENIARKSGANDFLCKPYNIYELEKKVNHHLSNGTHPFPI